MFTAKQEYMEKHGEMLDAIFRYATEGIVVSDVSGRIVMANRTAEEQFGFEREGMIGLTIEDLVPGDIASKHVEHRRHYTDDPHPRYMGMGFDLYAKRKDGSVFPVEISLSHFTTTEGKFVLSFVADITARKKQEEFIKKMNRELEDYSRALEVSNRDLEQFAYIASHDMQEPLRKIQAYAYRVSTRERDKLSARGKDHLDRLVQSATRMQKLINDLLLFSKISKRPTGFRQVDLAKVVEDVLSDLEVLIDQSEADISVAQLPVVEADSGQMHRLFQNLISNACKFVPEGEKPVVKIYTDHSIQDAVTIHFEDQGIGFDEDQLEMAFTAFQRLQGRKYEGSGIGLAVCKRIVENHGGSITARSRPGKGATFMVTLPVSQTG